VLVPRRRAGCCWELRVVAREQYSRQSALSLGAPSADGGHERVSLEIVIACTVLGAAAGRWWAVLASVPIGVAVGMYVDFEGMSSTEVGILAGLAAAVSIAAGVVVRLLVARVARAGSDRS
jgi:hypothetical protein